ncbi:MAG: 3-hydroxybutyryl-CoA dehydrogenase [Pseudomonas sp.]|uniref:Putative 3-hydroxybutyryl-CoA dehydrogenase n=1 Tax=Pseudomonas putida TaxID=303 RepID=M5AWX2_PSEPU|nr:3-hydroxybutyryl-CoA dehydrogenase [Pseudomonas monteilii]MBA4681431.1 3-hydroxybutyryl-CoA dehydrogenase [Pseudomonas sp.]MDD2126945.1 3-hydroxybutyryl-CoA dehydrogenase [Pseudomonas monteilii]BAN13294.1 putative 3-hydroxybutyryl-CoA dehydrogenase [Pseudomonas putida]
MQINKVGVVGAGTMGNGIAQVCATAGLSVVMLDIDQQSLERGLHTVSGSLERLVRKEQLSAAERDSALRRIKSTTDYADLADVDLVIEAASEVEKIKLAIIQTLDKTVRQDAIIASNTSSMSITKLAAASGAPNRFIGMHFFNPVPVMLLVELIRGLQTDDATHQAAGQFVEIIKKTAISVRNSAGFAVNRILVPMINEAVFVLQEGIASARDIDEGMRLGCNHVIGPLALADLIGLDTLLSVMETFYNSFNDSKYRPAPLLREMVEAGYLGRKSGQGFYSY